jgi:hypothetical protein
MFEAKEPPLVPFVSRSGPPERGIGAFRHLGSVEAGTRGRVVRGRGAPRSLPSGGWPRSVTAKSPVL